MVFYHISGKETGLLYVRQTENGMKKITNSMHLTVVLKPPELRLLISSYNIPTPRLKFSA